MRLIDAEELEKANCGRCKESKDGKWSIDCLWISCQWGDVMPVIQKLPTVEPQSAWIPCSERLPEEQEDVLVYMKSGMYKSIHIGYAYNGGDWLIDGEFWYEEGDPSITHWMPLPEPPKEVQNVERD